MLRVRISYCNPSKTWHIVLRRDDDCEGENPWEPEARLFVRIAFIGKGDASMQDQEKKQHAMTSFALFGGLFMSPRKTSREVSRPSDFKPFNRK